jgi:hypothetical protein
MKINLFVDEFDNQFTYAELQLEYNKIIQLGKDFGFDSAVPYSVAQVIVHAKYLQDERSRLLYENINLKGELEYYYNNIRNALTSLKKCKRV